MADVFLPQFLKQKAVYWPPTGQDKNGKMTFGPPVEIKCRWEEKSVEFINSQGEKAISSCVVLVDRDLVGGGMLWLGKLKDLVQQTNPDIQKANIIQGWQKIPNIQAKKFVRKAMC